MSRSLGRGRLRTRRLWTKAPHCNMSSGSLDGIAIQKPAQRLLALHLVGQGGLGGVIEVQRHDVADTLMWSAGVMVFLDVTQGVMQMGLACIPLRLTLLSLCPSRSRRGQPAAYRFQNRGPPLRGLGRAENH